MIDVEATGSVTVVRLRHGKVNALDAELMARLTELLDGLAADGAGALVLTGNGRVFSAGVDLARVLDGGAGYVETLIPTLGRMLTTVFGYPGPVVAAVDGAAIAGGCVLACAADARIMADTAGPIGASELVVGVPFPVSALEVLRYACGHHAEAVVLRARLVSAAEAQAIGMVHDVVAAADLEEKAVAAAEELAAIPAAVYRSTKARLRRGALERIRADAALDAGVAEVWASPETAAGIARQLERLRSGRAR